MGEYFLIANDEKEQFIDPFELLSNDRFPGIMKSDFISNAILWLASSSMHEKWHDLKKGYYTTKYIGAWAGQKILVYGDYENEEKCRIIRSNYHNISIEVAAMLFELPTAVAFYLDNFSAGDGAYKKLFAKIALLKNAPTNVIEVFSKLYGKDWKAYALKSAYG